MPTFELQGPDGATFEVEAPHEAAALSAFRSHTAPSVASDAVQSAGAGLIRGTAGLLDLPQTAMDLSGQAGGWVGRKIGTLLGGTPSNDATITKPGGLVPSPTDLPKPGAAAIAGLEAATGPLHKPQTTLGHYAETAAEFVPGAGTKLAQLAKFALAPGVASEAAGQLTKGTAAEPWARAGAGLGTAGAAGFLAGPNAAERLAGRAARNVTPEQFDQAAALAASAREAGVPLMASEAIQSATQGATGLGRVQRLAESTVGGSAVLDPIMAQRPGQMARAADAGLDAIAARPADQARLGLDAQSAARRGVLATPEGQQLVEALAGAGPRVSPLEVGRTMQADLRSVREAREGARAGAAETDYAAAKAAPERYGVDRTVTVERPGPPELQTLDPGRAPAPAFGPDGPPTLAAMAPQRPATSTAADSGPSLARYIAENGGLGLERGDIKAAGLDRFHKPRVANLVREGGKSIDGFWREHLIERGYLPPDAGGGMARNVHDELIGLLEQEARGRKVYAGDWAGLRDEGNFGALSDAFQSGAAERMTDVRGALRGAGVDPTKVDPGILDRTAAALLRGDHSDPLHAYEQVVMASREPASRPVAREVPTTVTEQVAAPQFGQVQVQPAIDAVRGQLAGQKGDVASSLERALGHLHDGGRPDMSVQGLLHARERLDFDIASARAAGDGTKAGALQQARNALDAQLKELPEVAAADARFAQNSVPLEPFVDQARLAPASGFRDPYGRFPTMLPESVPENIAGSATRAAEFAGVASPGARRSFEDYLTTRALDGAGRRFGGSPLDVGADALRTRLQGEGDLLAQAPSARERLVRVLEARDGMAPVEASRLGQVAGEGRLDPQLAALFHKHASPSETGAALGAIAGQDGAAARGLVREQLGRTADDTVRSLDRVGRPDQTGGAQLAARLREPANAATRAGLEAAAPEAASGIDRLIDALAATGWRQDRGSLTAFNAENLRDLKNGGRMGQAVQLVTKPLATVHDKVSTAMLERTSGKLAELLASGEPGVRQIQELAAGRGRDALIAALAGARIAGRGMDHPR